MNYNLVWEMAKKDLAVAFKSKQILLMTILMPLLLAVFLPAMIILMIIETPINSFNASYEIFSQFIPPLTTDWYQLSEKQQSIIIFSVFSQLFVLLIPVMIGSLLSSDSIIGEKERQTVEGLFSLPVSDSEILLSKLVSSLLPIVALTWLISLLYVLVIDITTYSTINRILLPDLRFILLIGFLTPLLGQGSITFTIIISSKVSSSKDAQQLAGLYVLPVIALISGQLIALIFSELLIIIGILIIGIFDIIAFKIAVKIFNREKIMSSI